ncbi:MAG: DUF3866 family protein [Acidimicrobiales bacterium]
MPSFLTTTVTTVLSERPGLQRIELESGRRAYVLTALIGPVGVGDRVVVNTTAVDLGLGTGGWDVVHWNLSRESWSGPGGGHVMKLRYTSLQVDTGVTEEGGGALPADLGGMPVVACDLHSQVACVAAGFRHGAPGRRLVYLMTDSAALPLALSDLVADLRGEEWLAATVTCGQAFGGDHEAVNVHSGLQVARAAAQADAVVVGPGPGVVGTGTPLGFSGLEVAGVIDAAAYLGGRPVVAVRCSGADPRSRHRGISHHTRASVQVAAHVPMVAVPSGAGPRPPGLAELGEVVEVDVPPGLHGGVTTMGRDPADDPEFFLYSAAAGVLVARLV